MLICEYKTNYSKGGEPFKNTGKVRKFTTTTKQKAFEIVNSWNRQGSMKNLCRIFWHYHITMVREATIDEINDPKIHFRQV